MSDHLELKFGFDHQEGHVYVTTEGSPQVQQFSMLRFHPAWTAGEDAQASGHRFVSGCPTWFDMHAGEHLKDPAFWTDSYEQCTYGRGETKQDAWEDMVARIIYAMAVAGDSIAARLAESGAPSSGATPSPEGGGLPH